MGYGGCALDDIQKYKVTFVKPLTVKHFKTNATLYSLIALNDNALSNQNKT